MTYGSCRAVPSEEMNAQRLGGQLAYIVAGSLYIHDHRIFGEDGEFDGKSVFSESNMGWERPRVGRLW